ncbi:MAG: hypothetical protein H6779_03480 [Candidatus Nomurabacteria bacterium]|nr:hypothetical protein [Candidatus Nomurabacteria bacterium]USN87448.1 MAG: hypothetical protein H6779_03480 [Candidatus Nomurabacteria bacterium]
MTDINGYKQKLEEQLVQITGELESLGVQDKQTGDWIERPADHQVEADMNTEADISEEQEERQATLSDLEIEYRNIKRALEKIEAGTFGICEIDNHPIEEDRLAYKPTARTCKEHMNEEQNLPL